MTCVCLCIYKVFINYSHDKNSKITKYERNMVHDVNYFLLLVDVSQGNDFFQIFRPYILHENWHARLHFTNYNNFKLHYWKISFS